MSNFFSTYSSTIFPVLFLVVFFAIGIWAAVSRRGRNFNLEAMYGKVDVQDLGQISKNPYIGGMQKVKLLKCSSKSEQFYVLEIENNMTVGINITWMRIDNDAIDRIRSLIV